MFPKHYSLVKEHHDKFEVHDSRDDKTFHISKKELHPANQIKIMKMQKLNQGGVSGDDSDLGLMSESSGDSWFSPKLDPGQQEDHSIMMKEQSALPENAPVNVPVRDFSEISPSINPDPQQTMSPPPAVLDQQPQIAPPAAMPKTPAGNGAPTLAGFNANLNAIGQSVQRQAQMEGQQDQKLAKLQEEHVKQEQARLEQVNQKMSGYMAQTDQLANDIASNKIDPNHYWNSMGTGGKISASLGVLLSSLGQGLQGSTHNMAWETMQENVNRDIAAQKDNLGKKQTLLSDNLRMMGNLRDAEAATRVQTNAILQGQIAKMAAETNDPIRQEKAKQYILQLKNQSMPMQQQLAASQVTNDLKKSLAGKDLAGVDPATLVAHLVPKEHQKVVFDEIKDAQNIASLTPKIMAAFERGSSRNPVTAAQGQKEFEGLINTTVTEQEGTARQAAFDSIHKNMNPSGLTAMPGENAAKKRTVMEYLASKSSAPTAKGYGIDLSKFGSTSHQEAPEIKMRGGVKYQKVPGGWKKIGQ